MFFEKGQTMITITYSISEFAALKGCSRQAVYDNWKLFTWIKVPGSKKEKILYDKKAEKWQPKKVNK